MGKQCFMVKYVFLLLNIGLMKADFLRWALIVGSMLGRRAA